MSSRIFAPALILFITSACALFAGCAGSSPRRPAAAAEAPPPAESPAPEANATPAASDTVEARTLPPPNAAEVSGAVERIFKGAVTVNAAPAFAVGDFNGDEAQDLAVAVSPAPGRLGEINDELAGWIIKDPFAPAPAGAVPYGEARRRVLVEEADTLLAVIHGYGAEGWRDARATQTYVLKDAAGEGMSARAEGRPRLGRRGETAAARRRRDRPDGRGARGLHLLQRRALLLVRPARLQEAAPRARRPRRRGQGRTAVKGTKRRR
jgi:hypothetical protein